MISTSFKVVLSGLFVVALCSAARGQSISAASCNTSDVQNAINSASSGQTVNIPSGTCTWTSGVTISGKAINVVGAGAGRVVAVSSTPLSLTTGSVTLSVTGTGVSNPTPSINSGETLTLTELGTESNYMKGTVSSFDSASGSLTMNITSSGGSCKSNSYSNCKRWLVATPAATTILNSNPADAALFGITESTSGNVSISGIFFDHGAYRSHDITISYASGGQPVLIHDNRFRVNPNNPSPPMGNGDIIESSANRGVVWNNSFESDPFNIATVGGVDIADQSNVTNSWTTQSYWGSDDTSGNQSLYVEDNDFHAFGYANGNDNNARMVMRYNLYNNSGMQGTHGADTSFFGQRYFEAYNNVGRFDSYTDGTSFNLQGYVFLRGGTMLMTNNNLAAITSQDWGPKADVQMTVMNLQHKAGPDPCWGAGSSNGSDYHAPRQVGYGRVTGSGSAPNLGSNDSYTYVGDSEPVYLWGNSRTVTTNITDFGGTECSNPDHSSNYIQSGRDFFNGTAKPNWSPFSYPHPLRGGGTKSAQNPPPPTNVTAVAD